MKVKFSVSAIGNGRFEARYILTPTGGKDTLFVSLIRYNGFKLADLLATARRAVYSRAYYMRVKHGVPMQKVDIADIEWDEAVAELPESFARQYKKGALVYTPAYGAPAQEAPAEPALYELVMVSQGDASFPTIIKHDKPLLTLEEAFEAIKNQEVR